MYAFAITESKLDSSFPENQFHLEGVRKLNTLDVSVKNGGLLVLVNKDIPFKYLQRFHLPQDIRAIVLK